MSRQWINLLPESARRRIEHHRAFSRASWTSLGLTMVAAVAAIAAEYGRSQAIERRDAVEAEANRALAHEADRRRLELDVQALADAARLRQEADGQMPVLSYLGVFTDALPRHRRFASVELNATPEGLVGSFVVEGALSQAEIDAFVTIVGATKPFVDLRSDQTTNGFTRIVGRVPADRAYAVVYDDADVRANEKGSTDEE